MDGPDAAPSFDPAILADLLDGFRRGLDGPTATLRDRLGRVLDHPALLDGTQRRQVATMIGVCDGLMDLTRDFFEIVGHRRALSGPPRRDRFSIRSLMAEVDAAFAPRAAERGLSWACGLDGPDASISSDRGDCRRIVEVLASNAIAFARPGGSVSIRAGADGLGGWSVVVDDDGPGISAEDLGRVFEPFSRGERGDRSDSNGLGLALAGALVDRLGGEIAIDPADAGTGTRVSVLFASSGPADPAPGSGRGRAGPIRGRRGPGGP